MLNGGGCLWSPLKNILFLSEKVPRQEGRVSLPRERCKLIMTDSTYSNLRGTGYTPFRGALGTVYPIQSPFRDKSIN